MIYCDVHVVVEWRYCRTIISRHSRLAGSRSIARPRGGLRRTRPLLQPAAWTVCRATRMEAIERKFASDCA